MIHGFKIPLDLSLFIIDSDENLHGLNLYEGRLNKEVIINYFKSKNTENALVLICGTSDFNHLVKNCMDDVNHSSIHIFE